MHENGSDCTWYKVNYTVERGGAEFGSEHVNNKDKILWARNSADWYVTLNNAPNESIHVQIVFFLEDLTAALLTSRLNDVLMVL